MANEIEKAVQSIATEIVNYVKGAAEMRVETRYAEIGGDGAAELGGAGDGAQSSEQRLAALRQESRLAALTVVQLDGDSLTVVPLQRGAESGELELDADLLAEHRSHVNAAIEYRARILNALLDLLRSRGRQL